MEGWENTYSNSQWMLETISLSKFSDVLIFCLKIQSFTAVDAKVLFHIANKNK